MIFLALGLLLSAHVIDGFVNGPTTQTVAPGKQASIRFIANESTSVVWTHMDTRAIIGQCSGNSTLLLGDSSLYSLLLNRTAKTKVVCQLTLQATVVTAGVYRCDVGPAGKPVSREFFSVGLTTTANRTDLAPGRASVDACCAAKNVSAGCRRACRPAILDFTKFNFSACAADLPHLRTCAGAGRDHVRCCRRRGVPVGPCLQLCAAGKVSVANATACPVKSIVQCLYEGQEAIPSPPRNVFVETLTRTSIVVHWNLPLDNTAFLSAYLVFWKSSVAVAFKSVHVDRRTLRQSLTVSMNERYSVYVQAVGPHGASLPSTVVSFSTTEEYFYHHPNGSQTIDDCCKAGGVSLTCRKLMCSGIPKHVTISQVMKCMKYWPRIVKCFAGGRSHIPCCTTNGVKPECTKYCSGKEENTKRSDLVCMTNFRVISSCFDAGVRTIPSHPRNLRATLVVQESVSLEWDAPASLGDAKAVVLYKVLYRNISAGGLTSYSSNAALSARKFTLTNLIPGTTYDVSIIAYNKHGASLPSPALRPTTPLGTPYKGPAANTAYDPLPCCTGAGVPKACRVLCDLSKTDTTVPDSCKASAMKVAHCLADNRNHLDCCRRNAAINVNCHPLCALDLTKPAAAWPSADIVWGCLRTSSALGLRQCYSSGHRLLPSPPRALMLRILKSEAAEISFKAPARHPGVAHYSVLLFTDGALNKSVSRSRYSLWRTVSVKPTVKGVVLLSKLLPNTEYTVQVVAVTKDARQSLPSNSISFRTLPILPADWAKNKDPNFDRLNVTTCCTKKGVSAACQPLCDTTDASTLLWNKTAAERCIGDLKEIVHCSADKRNHQPCCQSRRVPTFCLPACSGKVTPNFTASAVCVQFFPEIRSCFLDGYEKLPAPPLISEVRPLTQNSVSIKFTEPSSNKGVAGGVFYYVYYQSKGAKVWFVRQKVKSPLVLNRLNSSTAYSVFLIAVSNNGTSLPSAVFRVATFANSPFSVYIISSSPGFLVKQGQTVTLECHTPPDLRSVASFAWYHNGPHKVNTSSVLRLQKVSHSDAGEYVCQVKALNKTVTRSVFLKVQIKLSVTPLAALVRAKLYTSVTIGCLFEGFPTSVEWLRNKVKVAGDKRYLVSTKNDRYHTRTELTIQQVTDASYAEYKCQGKNDFGQAAHPILVVKPSYSGLPPTVKPLPAEVNSTECCRNLGVSADCMAACTFGSIASVLAKHTKCRFEFPNIFHCLSDRRNHSSCCVARKLPPQCRPLCAGALPAMTRGSLACYQRSSLDHTVVCIEEGTRILPTAPSSLQVMARTRDTLSLKWSPPTKRGLYVLSYQLRLEPQDAQPSVRERVLDVGRVVSYTVRDLKSGVTFRVSVRAKNNNGTSGYSAPRTTSTLGLPRPPQHLHGELIGGVSIKLSWEMPKFSVIAVTHFSVFWGAEMEKQTKNDTAGRKLELLFKCLSPKTKYRFQVAAVNQYGTSARSQETIVSTKSNSNPHCENRNKPVTKYKTDNRGLSAVMIMLLLLVLGLGGLGLFVYMNRNNPRYAWPGWLRRIPGMQPTGQPLATHDFDNPVHFANLEEEDDSRVSINGRGRGNHVDFGAMSSDA